MFWALAPARSSNSPLPRVQKRRREDAAKPSLRTNVSRSHDAHLRSCELEVPAMIPTRGCAHVSYEQRSVGVFEEVQGNVSTGVCSYFHHTSASMCKCCVVSGLLFSFVSFRLRCMRACGGPLLSLATVLLSAAV